MARHVTKVRSNWLGVARIAGRLALALGIDLSMYFLIYHRQQLQSCGNQTQPLPRVGE